MKKINIAYIDGQNLEYGTTKCNKCSENLNIELRDIRLEDCVCGKAWRVDLQKFRIYLKENYNVEEAYYVFGYLLDICMEKMKTYTEQYKRQVL